MLIRSTVIPAAALLATAAPALATKVKSVAITAKATVTASTISCDSLNDTGVPCPPPTGPVPVIGETIDIVGGFSNLERFGPFDPNGTSAFPGAFDKAEKFNFDILSGGSLYYTLNSRDGDSFDTSFSLTLVNGRVTGFFLRDWRETFDRSTLGNTSLSLLFERYVPDVISNENDPLFLFTYSLQARLDPNSLSIIQSPAIPEPASWALLITGFGIVGATLRRRTAARA
jgi:hypothetical protein